MLILPWTEGNGVELGNLYPPLVLFVAKLVATKNSTTEHQANVERSSKHGYVKALVTLKSKSKLFAWRLEVSLQIYGSEL